MSSRSPTRERGSSYRSSSHRSSRDEYSRSSWRDRDLDRRDRDSDRRRDRDRGYDSYYDKDRSRRKNSYDSKSSRSTREYERDRREYDRDSRRSRSPRHRGSDSHRLTSSNHRTDERDRKDSSITKSSTESKETISSNFDRTNVNSVEVKEARSTSDHNSSSNTATTTPEISQAALDEEKKRKRMERLEQWKLKKAQEKAKAEALSKSASPAPDTVSKGSSSIAPSDSGSNLRNTDTDQTLKKNVFKPLTMSKNAPVSKFRLGAIKNPSNVNLGFEDTTNPLAPKGITKLKTNGDDTVMNEAPPVEEEIDPLDAFMNAIETTDTAPSATSSSLPDIIMDEENERSTNDTLDEFENNPEEFKAQLEKKKRKDIPIVDHSKMNYEPFRKTFYVEPPEIAAMTDEEADMMRLELDGIKIRGLNCPKPVLKWSQFGLPVPTMNVINSLGYEKPTAIQAQAIPSIMSGRDVIGVAKTGSGKTMAFLLPLFRQIKDQRPLLKHEGPMALVMTPTRELAVQIYRECKPFLKALNLRAICAYGGSPIKDQIADLKRGAEIVVCTPGRMIDLLAANAGRVINLHRVTYLVLDEADRMFDMGFEPQVMKIINNIRPDRQTVLFSATFPRQMETLARKTLKKAIEIIVGARSVVAPEITQIVEVRSAETKFTRLLELLGEFYNKSSDSRALIFVDRQESADMLLKDLIQRGYPCLSIHGGKDQIDRDSAIADFKSGVTSLLIATSIAARGLDVKQLKLVVNYDAPNHMEDYVHRVGRTGRAGNTGTAVTFIEPGQDRAAVDIAKALKLSKVEVPEKLQEIVDKFMAKVKEGKEKYVSSGFGGKGLEKLDEARDTAMKLERKAYGQDDEKETATEEIEDSREVGKSEESLHSLYSIAPTVVKQGHHASTLEKMSKRNGVLRAGAAPDNHGPDTSAFHTTLEINDYPQQARWKVTNNSNITKIIEANSTSITTKGQYYPPGKEPGEGEERKLYLLIEGQTELSVANARKELAALLIAGMEEAAQSESRAPAGRYTIK